MKIQKLQGKELIQTIVALLLLLAIALVSIFVLSKPATDPNTYVKTIQSIDEKKATVMGITASAAAASTGLAMIPGDATTPIANELAEISSYLMIVVCVLVLEKSLLTVLGYLAFNILVPLACLFFGIYILSEKRILKEFAIKFAVFGIILVAIIPFSLKISDMIYESNKATVEQVTADIEENSNISEEEQNKSWFSSIIEKIGEGVSDATEAAKKVLNSFIDAIALFIISYCAIPILIVLLTLWFTKLLFGISIPESQKNKIKDGFKKFQKKEKGLLTHGEE